MMRVVIVPVMLIVAMVIVGRMLQRLAKRRKLLNILFHII